MRCRRVLGEAPSGRVLDDLLAIGTSAVMERAVPLGDTLLLPSRLVFTLPPEDLRWFESPRSRVVLTRSLRRAVRRGAAQALSRLCRADGAPRVVAGGGDLRVTLVPGDVREADARFEVGPAEDR